MTTVAEAAVATVAAVTAVVKVKAAVAAAGSVIPELSPQLTLMVISLQQMNIYFHLPLPTLLLLRLRLRQTGFNGVAG